MKLIRTITTLYLLFVSITASGQNEQIPENLKKNANAVVRYSKSSFKINSAESAQFSTKYMITILNKNGDQFADLIVYYDKFIKVSNIVGKIYDSNGKLIKKIEKKDIIDHSITSGGTLFDDNRIKYVEVNQNKYPYTVEFEYTLNYNGFINFHRFTPVEDYNISVENSEYIVKTDKSYQFHYKTNNLDIEPNIAIENNEIFYKWTVKNIEAIKDEPYNPPFSEITPSIYFAPNHFYYDGYEGNQSTWKEYGKWVYQLLEGRDQLSENTKLQIHELVKDISDSTQKAKLVYEYMQSKTRYVSIQLGIGGFQPFSAMEVDNVGYGDCKALANYTKALLKEAGVQSIYTEIYGGVNKKEFMPDFPGTNQTNHIILCVPLQQDTVWLECTNQRQPFGYLGRFTDDRYAILITAEGGKLAKTKKYTQSENTQIRTIDAVIDQNQKLISKVHTQYKGIQFDNISYQFLQSPEDQRKNLFKNLDLTNFSIASFNYSQDKDIIPIANEDVEIEINNYATVLGKRMFIPLNLLNKQSYIPKKLESRKTQIVMNVAFSDYDTITYIIPENYTIEYLPDSIFIQNQFGEYKSTVQQNDNKIIYTRFYKKNAGRFPPESYNDLIEFYKAIKKADNCKAVIIEKN